MPTRNPFTSVKKKISLKDLFIGRTSQQADDKLKWTTAPRYAQSTRTVDVFLTSECIHLYILFTLPRYLFREVSIM